MPDQVPNSGSQVGERPDADTISEQAAVLATHDQFWQSYARRDLDGRFSVVADDVTFFGTSRHERAANKVAYRAMNEKGVEQYPTPFLIEYLWLEVHVLGETAWTECDSCWVKDFNGTPGSDVLRLTTVFHRRNGNWLVVHVHGSEPDYRLQEGEYMTNAKVMARNKELEGMVAERMRQLNVEKKRSEDLLLNILPHDVAEELMDTGTAVARQYEKVTILFSDFEDFTGASERLSPQELVGELNACFGAFDHIITARGLEKIKTIGDSYMCVGGLPDPKTSTSADVVQAALEMQAFIAARKVEREAHHLPAFEMRVGIHTGPVVAGIVGVKKFQYDLWGDTVNTASRMESSGEVGQVNISEATYALVKDEPDLTFTPRGKVQAKGKGEMEMYFVKQ
ncbi:MAG: adenylate/guanylate cyclase domain-containing protein, partial [Flavobacteriales bacterium]